MNRLLVIIGILAVIGVAVWALVLRPVPEPSAPTEPAAEPTLSITTPETPAQQAEPSSTTIFTSPVSAGVQYTLELPESLVVNRISEARSEFKFIGPESEPSTEITDGYYISAYVIATSSTPTQYATSAGQLATSSAYTLVSFNSAAYATRSALGDDLIEHLVAAAPSADVLIDLSLTAYGPRAAEYRNEIQSILDSLDINVASESATSVPSDVKEMISAKSDLIRVEQPAPMTAIGDPLTIDGEARGQWFFEASFPVTLVDWDGRIVAESFVTTEGEWMTEEFVPYSGSIEFVSPYEVGSPEFMRRGTLILQKANPSGLPENDDALEIPVRFEPR